MTELAQFHFIRPLWLFAFIPLVVLIWMMITRKLGSRSWETVCDAALLPFILIRMQTGSRRLSILGTFLGGALAILALAGPAWERLPQPVFSAQSSLVIALDLSRSMDANDINPSRITRARYKIADILDQRKEGQTALLVYAGDAFTVTPLTDDAATIKSQLTALETDIMPVQGNRTDIAIRRSMDLLKQAGLSKGDILLITDEADLEQAVSEAVTAKGLGYRVSFLGVGTSHGTPVSLSDGSFLKDENGEIVIPVLDEKPLRELARAGGGYYHRMTLDDSDLTVLNRIFSGVDMDDDFTSTELQTDVWKEQGPWLLILLLPLAAALFRRGYLVLFLVFLLPFPDTANAFDWDGLWLNRDTRARRALDAGDPERAAELFRQPEWKGPAQYQARNYEGAIESLQDLRDTESVYNAGNALARLGRYEDAISAYDRVLEKDPDHADALYNKQLLQHELEQQQNNQQNNQQDQQQQPADNRDQQGNTDQQQEQQGDQMNDDQQESGNQSEQQAEQDQQQPENQDQQEQQAGNDENQPQQQDENSQMAARDDEPLDEEQQATEQWLRRIPDDPAGLLRRKFLYQYKLRSEPLPSGEKSW